MELQSAGARAGGAVLTALVVVLPLAFGPGLTRPYDLPKQSVFFLIAAAALWAFALSGRRGAGVRALPLFLPVSAYAVATLLSLTRAVNLYEGLLGSAQALIALGLFWVAACELTEPKAVITLFHWASLGAGLVSLFGILQAWQLNTPMVPVVGPGSTFGNANVAAEYLVLVFPVAFALFFLADTGLETALRALVAALIATYLSYTGTRAAWTGVALAALVLLLLLRRRRPSAASLFRLSRGKAWGLAAILVFTLAMNVLPRLGPPKSAVSELPVPELAVIPASVRLVSSREQGRRELLLPEERRPTFDPASIKHRAAIWANTLVMVKDHPLLGVGKGNFQFFYPRYARTVTPDIEMGRYSHRVRDAHNDYLQLLAETGVLGFATFAWIVVGLARRLLRGFTPARPPLWSLIGATTAFGLLALGGSAFFGFPFEQPTQGALFWILAGLLWRATEPPEDDGRAPRRVPLAARPVLVALAVLATAATAWGVQVLRAEASYSRGLRAYGEERHDEAESHLKRAARLNPFDAHYAFFLGVYGIMQARYADAAEHSARAVALDPNHISSLNNLGVALGYLGRYPEAIRAFERALEIWPDFIDARNNLATAYAKMGQRDRAIAQFREVLRIRPNDRTARTGLYRLLQQGAL